MPLSEPTLWHGKVIATALSRLGGPGRQGKPSKKKKNQVAASQAKEEAAEPKEQEQKPERREKEKERIAHQLHTKKSRSVTLRSQ